MERMTLDVKDVARILGISERSAYYLVKREDFPSLNIGRRIVIPEDAFYKWLNKKAGTQVVNK